SLPARGAARGQYPVVAGELAQRDLARARERVLAADEDGIGIGEQEFLLDVARPRRPPENPEQEVEVAGAQRIEQRLVGTIRDADRCAWIEREKSPDRVGQQIGAGMRDVADGYSRREDTLGCANLLDAVFELPERDLEPA